SASPWVSTRKTCSTTARSTTSIPKHSSTVATASCGRAPWAYAWDTASDGGDLRHHRTGRAAGAPGRTRLDRAGGAVLRVRAQLPGSAAAVDPGQADPGRPG